jgi:hypothetical protein
MGKNAVAVIFLYYTAMRRRWRVLRTAYNWGFANAANAGKDQCSLTTWKSSHTIFSVPNNSTNSTGALPVDLIWLTATTVKLKLNWLINIQRESTNILDKVLREWFIDQAYLCRNRHRQNPGPTRPDPGLARYRIRVGFGNPVRISWTGGPIAIFIELEFPQNRIKRISEFWIELKLK